MPELNPNLQAFLKSLNAGLKMRNAADFKATPINMREAMAKLNRLMLKKRPFIKGIWDDLVPSSKYTVPVRIFHPEPGEKRPVLLYFHGGGHVTGGVSEYDPILRRLCQVTGYVVVGVEYRLAPECPYPAGIEDAHTVLLGIRSALSARGILHEEEISLAGDSAGGAIAASLMEKVQGDPDIPLKRCVLIYPGLDYTMSFPSMEENGTGYFLEKDSILWFYKQYLQDGEAPEAISPLRGKITKDLPETLVISAEFCPLRDESLAYVEKLREAGVRVSHIHFDGMVHAFMNMEAVVPEECAQLYQDIADFLNPESIQDHNSHTLLNKGDCHAEKNSHWPGPAGGGGRHRRGGNR